RTGDLWVGTTRGLNHIVQGHVENWSADRGLGNASVTALTLDNAGTLWVGTDQGLFHLIHHRFVPFTTLNGLPGNSISTLAAAPDGSLWIGTLGNGIARMRPASLSIEVQPLPWKEISSLFLDRDGTLWIAFDRHGIGRLIRGRFELYGVAQGLPSDRCTSAIFEDREGDLWIGLLDAGLVELRDAKFSVFGKSEGLSGSYIGNVLEAQDDTLWIGADSNGLDHILPDGRVEVWDRRRGLPNQAVFALARARDGSIWVGYRRGALAQIHNGHVSVFHDPQASDSSINALLDDSQGRLWVGYFGKGFARFENGRFHHITLSGRVSGFTESRDGALWIASDGDGLLRFVDGSLTRFTTAEGLPSDHVMCVYADRAGRLWIGTASGGLSLLRGGRIVSWKPRQGLPASTIGSILEDNLGHLWMGSDNGIFRVGIAELLQSAGQPDARLHPVLYGIADGLRSRETLYGSMPCAWKAHDGRLWFATIRGAAVIDPARIPEDRLPPPVWIQSLTFDSRPVSPVNGLRLGPGSGNLELAFTAPSFVAPQNIQYRYRLVGFDDSWTNAGSRRTVWYTNLSPGHYTFQVQAANSDGVWNLTGAGLSFSLAPPLERTPLAYALYAVLALFLAWGTITLRTRQLTRRQRELTRLVAERTAQLEAEKAALEETRRELQIQATHDSLTGLFNRAAMLEHLHREIARAARERTTLGVLIADLDHFKHINDRYGHPCGDDIIREAAARFRGAMRTYDIVGRYGGEEFLILLPSFDLSRNSKRVDDLLDAIRARPFSTEATRIALTCSIGVATWRTDIDSPDPREVIARADTALYVAKNLGRNRASFEVRGLNATPEPVSPVTPSG
ncbi:MAG: diguanylate cyclase, partial [Acidobacteriota bacterium]